MRKLLLFGLLGTLLGACGSTTGGGTDGGTTAGGAGGGTTGGGTGGGDTGGGTGGGDTGGGTGGGTAGGGTGGGTTGGGTGGGTTGGGTGGGTNPVDLMWAQRAFAKASNPWIGDRFGASISISADGTRLAVSSVFEESAATGVGGSQSSNGASASGAVYVFVRTGSTWTQEAYIKASNTEQNDEFGKSVSLSADGSRLAVGAWGEDSSATGINGNQANNSAGSSGAVYVFARSGSTWAQEAYVKASNTSQADSFGFKVALSADASRLAVTAINEDSNATGVNGNQTNNSTNAAGAVYVFARSGSTWSQEAYVKASNPDALDSFGRAISLSADGSRLAVGANGESSNATGVGGDQSNNAASRSGAVYVFSRLGSTWSQEAYVKASNTESNDGFGDSVSLSGDGSRLAVGAPGERSSATGVGGDQSNNGSFSAGAAYVFARSGSTWAQTAYIKASNTDSGDSFGGCLSLSSDGRVLAVGAVAEDSNATGVGGDQTNNAASRSGAAYVFASTGATWVQTAYIKASNADVDDLFGQELALSGDGRWLGVGATEESGDQTGISAGTGSPPGTYTPRGSQSGAAYVFAGN